jgi:hypothetical protein
MYIYKLLKRWAKGSISMLLFWGVPKCIEEIVMGLLKKCSSKAPERGGAEGKESPKLTIGMTLVPILWHSHTEREENTEGELMSTGDAICVRQWLIELSIVK